MTTFSHSAHCPPSEATMSAKPAMAAAKPAVPAATATATVAAASPSCGREGQTGRRRRHHPDHGQPAGVEMGLQRRP